MTSREPKGLPAAITRLAAQFAEQRRDLAELVRGRAETHHGHLQRVDKLVDGQARRANAIERKLTRARGALARTAAYTGKAGRLWSRKTRAELTLLDRLHRIADSTRPIIVGPWTGEVGYEVLYWAPFVRWFVETYGIDRERIHILSRGGTVSWYEGISSRYVDALSFYSTDEFRDRVAERRWMKQDAVGALDRDILRRARGALSVSRPLLLHPLIMFQAFKRYWGGGAGINDVLERTSHRKLTSPGPLPGLPDRYVAVRFYFRTSFPNTPENRALVAKTLSVLAAATDVVLLNPGFQIDDHIDVDIFRGGRIHTIDHLLTPERNLDVQTAVLARALTFIGSYGGFSYLAPLLGVRSIAFFSERTFKTAHLELAEHVFDRVGGGTLTTIDVADVAQLASLLPVPAVAVS
jgi:hypothetical protein